MVKRHNKVDNNLVNAARRGDTERVKYYLKKCKNKEAQEDAIFWLALGGDWDIVRYMLEQGVDNWKIMGIAAKQGQMDIVKLILGKGKSCHLPSAIAKAAEGGHIDIVKFLLDNGAENYNGAMFFASRTGYIDIVQLMLDKGATYYNDAMASAAYGGHINIVELMLNKGANDYDKALYKASAADCLDIIYLMLDKGAKPLPHALVSDDTAVLITEYMKGKEKLL